jgi:EAL domain-containing protein (putative c-di-GMP-specific phosphodiesterase class I)
VEQATEVVNGVIAISLFGLAAQMLVAVARNCVRGDDQGRLSMLGLSAAVLVGFAGEIHAVLRRTGLALHVLTVEVTETAVFDSDERVARLVRRAAAMEAGNYRITECGK